MEIKYSDQLKVARYALVRYATKLIVSKIASAVPWLFGTPIIGPFASYLVGDVVGKILNVLFNDVEFMAFVANTKLRTQRQATRFDQTVDAKNNLPATATDEDVKRAEELSNKAFDDLVKYSS